MLNSRKKKEEYIPIFDLFTHDFFEAWNIEKQKERGLVNNNGYFAEIQGNGTIVIYLRTRATRKAIFKKERSWIDDPLLFKLLVNILSDYHRYFDNKKNMVFNGAWMDVILLRSA